MAYNLTNSVDGRLRVAVHLSNRLTLHDLATHVTSEIERELPYISWDEKESYDYSSFVKKELTGKATVMKWVRGSIESYGLETPHYRVGDNNLERLLEEVEKRVTELWA